MVIKYIACDGKEFNNKQDCINYEKPLNTVSARLPDLVLKDFILPPLSVMYNNYINDGGYLKELDYIKIENLLIKSPADAIRVRDILIELGYEKFGRKIEKKLRKFPDVLSLISEDSLASSRHYIKFCYMYQQYEVALEHMEEVKNMIVAQFGNNIYELIHKNLYNKKELHYIIDKRLDEDEHEE